VIRVHRIPYSTNVERVALAAARKGIEVEWVDHDPGDRSALLALSGQKLVPVAEIEGEVIADSTLIVERLETLMPEPALFPYGAAERAHVTIFVDWFNRVWKGPPNAIEGERSLRDPDHGVIAELRERTHATLALFEDMLSASDFLFGRALGAADVCAFPFLKFAAIDPIDGDDEPFHSILAECLRPAEAPRLVDWIARIDAMPRA
jgi:glutathione S-transferase